MEFKVVYKQSAFNHGVTEEDIIWAFNTARYDSLLDGFDTNGNLLEIMYNDLGENEVSVFHAMKCRNMLLSLLVQ